MTRIHIGCGTNVLPGWINIDRESRAPGVLTGIDPWDLPYPDASVQEILSEHVFEHFTFAEEQLIWREMARVISPGGVLRLEVPDFEWVCETFLAAKDEWIAFYQTGHADHYAGHGRALDQRWGILQTMFFGNQNGPGQFHRCAYTEGKLRALAGMTGFQAASMEKIFNKGGQALRAEMVRIS